jgi:hypothetical protein
MTHEEFFRKFDEKQEGLLPAKHSQRVGASLSVQIHSRGARPKYNVGRETIIPETYDSRFDRLFKTRLLNRHANESDALYNWRLSIYSPVAKEIFDRFLNFARGSIVQPNNYNIIVDPKTDEYFDQYDIHEEIWEAIEFLLENPNGYMAVIIGDYDGDMTKPVGPSIEMICPSKVLMQDKESIAFEDDCNIYFLDKFQQVKRDKYGVIQVIVHNFGEIPCWQIDNNFIQPFVFWADLLVRNMSDDEMMTKQYSYPIKQSVEPSCVACNGVGRINVNNTEKYPGGWGLEVCNTCNGSGIMSINPGEIYTITEEKLMKLGNVMPDMAKFITPDVAIPEYHFKRWQAFYDRCEKSLYINKDIPVTNKSGEAKKEDRKDQYTYMSTISQFLFVQIKKAVEFIAAYRNYNGATQTYEKQEVIIYPPKQLDLMTNSDLVNELVDVQTKTDDAMILGEMQYVVTNKIYRDDAVQSKINEILYDTDYLYGICGDGLKLKYLSGLYTSEDKLIHEKGYKILMRIAKEMSYDVFVNTDNTVLIEKLKTEVATMVPQGIYNQNG